MNITKEGEGQVTPKKESSITIIKNELSEAIFEKDDKNEPWFNNNCSDENLKKHLNRENCDISRIQFHDGKYTASKLIVYFK